MVINMICGGEEEGIGGYSVLESAAYTASTLTVELPAKPKLVIVVLRNGSIVANGMFAYASLDPVTDSYVAEIQTHASGGTVAWTDTSEYAIWDEDEKTFSMRVRSGSTMSGYCTYHAVGLECDEYSGPFTVTPETIAQTLSTANKLMPQDVSVLAIPYARASNPSGGDTVTIG